jgi:hypothetical protein
MIGLAEYVDDLHRDEWTTKLGVCGDSPYLLIDRVIDYTEGLDAPDA